MSLTTGRIKQIHSSTVTSRTGPSYVLHGQGRSDGIETASSSGSAHDVTKERTFKLNTIVSQTADEQVELVAEDLVAVAYKRFKTVFGMFPDDNVDITIEQLDHRGPPASCDQPVNN
eukprot:583668-Amphidinium_carterae.1